MRNKNFRRYSRPRRKEGESIVQNDLSYTPSQMMQMAEKGVAISTQNVNPDNFYDGDINSSFELGIDRLRGVDIADCWQAEQSIKKKAKNGLKNDIRMFGNKIIEKGE